MPASEDDSGCEVIDLTADDDNDSAQDAAKLSCMQYQNSGSPLKAADTAQTVETAELAAANCSVERPPEVSEAGTSSRLPDQATMAELCMLNAYGMDLVAVISCMLQHFEDWPGTHMDQCVWRCSGVCVDHFKHNSTPQQADLMQLEATELQSSCSGFALFSVILSCRCLLLLDM
jgi:hypothetical protein